MSSAGTCPPVAVVMGSNSDWATMRHTAAVLEELVGFCPSPRDRRMSGSCTR